MTIEKKKKQLIICNWWLLWMITKKKKKNWETVRRDDVSNMHGWFIVYICVRIHADLRDSPKILRDDENDITMTTWNCDLRIERSREDSWMDHTTCDERVCEPDSRLDNWLVGFHAHNYRWAKSYFNWYSASPTWRKLHNSRLNYMKTRYIRLFFSGQDRPDRIISGSDTGLCVCVCVFCGTSGIPMYRVFNHQKQKK